MSKSRLTQTLAVITKKIKWPENKSIGYEGSDRKDKYLNPLLTPPKTPLSPEEFNRPQQLDHRTSQSFDWINPFVDKYYYHHLFLGFVFFSVVGAWIWSYAPDLLGSNSTSKPAAEVRKQQKSLFQDLEFRLYNFLPLRVTSSLWGKINSYDLPVWMRTRLYDLFCRTYNCDMSEALEGDYRNYKNLKEFFSRRLKPDSRPISLEPGVVSPADGLVLHFGPVTDGRIERVKGLNYSVQAFLGLPSKDYERELIVDKDNNELYNCIIYLAPGDYHRFHSPANWLVKHRKHFPGRLLSVRPSLMKRMPEVLHINERVCYVGRWEHGFFSMTAVGATNVGSIKVNFDEDLRTNRRHLWRPDRYACFEHKFSEDVQLKAGQDFGEFNFGSTIVLIFEAPKNSTFDVKANEKIKYGQLMARIEPPTGPTTITAKTTSAKIN